MNSAEQKIAQGRRRRPVLASIWPGFITILPIKYNFANGATVFLEETKEMHSFTALSHLV